jgi:hypothetical protein
LFCALLFNFLEFDAFRQGHCKIFPGRRDVAPRRERRRRARARRTAPRRLGPPASRGRPSPGHTPTEAASESTPSSRRAPSGRERPTDHRSVPRLPAVHSFLGRHLLLGTSPSILGHHKGALPPLHRADPRSCPCVAPDRPPRSPPCPPRRAASSGRLRTKTSCSPPSLASTIAPQPPHAPASSPCRRNSSRGGHRAWPAAPPLAGPFPVATEPGNGSPMTQGSSPARARPAPAGGWPEFGRTAAARPPRDHIAKTNFFSRA